MNLPALQHRALELAKTAQGNGEVPIGALVIDPEGVIIAEATNTKEALQNPCGHAEIEALSLAGKALGTWRLLDCTLLVTLEPCTMCLAAALHARVARVVYGAADAKAGAVSLGYRFHEDTRLNHAFKVEHFPHPESGLILTQFFKSKRGSGRQT